MVYKQKDSEDEYYDEEDEVVDKNSGDARDEEPVEGQKIVRKPKQPKEK